MILVVESLFFFLVEHDEFVIDVLDHRHVVVVDTLLVEILVSQTPVVRNDGLVCMQIVGRIYLCLVENYPALLYQKSIHLVLVSVARHDKNYLHHFVVVLLKKENFHDMHHLKDNVVFHYLVKNFHLAVVLVLDLNHERILEVVDYHTFVDTYCDEVVQIVDGVHKHWCRCNEGYYLAVHNNHRVFLVDREDEVDLHALAYNLEEDFHDLDTYLVQ
mmetsp:Transcript_18367/g.23890  ORF Transcript_18367/g.23890 Transcript_18367/m.23890 type:complete len:216 (+) Transcript_18367:492-1139(+)